LLICCRATVQEATQFIRLTEQDSLPDYDPAQEAWISKKPRPLEYFYGSDTPFPALHSTQKAPHRLFAMGALYFVTARRHR
jgi:hypothetical protein